MFNLDNQFWQLVRSEWLPRDASCCSSAGTVAVAINLLRGLRDRRALAAGPPRPRCPSTTSPAGAWCFDFYVLAVVPFLCLNLGRLAVSPLLTPPARRRRGRGRGRRRGPRCSGATGTADTRAAPLHRSARGSPAAGHRLDQAPTPPGTEPDRDPRRRLGPTCTSRDWAGRPSPMPTATGRSRSTRRSAAASSTTTGARWTTSSCRRGLEAFLADTGNTVADRGAAATPASSGAGKRTATSIELWKVNRPGATEAGPARRRARRTSRPASSATGRSSARTARSPRRARPTPCCAPSGRTTAPAFDRTWGWTEAQPAATARGCSPGSGRTAPWSTATGPRTRTRTPPSPC